MDGNCKLLSFLLQEGLDVNNRDAWKCLALLLKILYTAPKSKKIIIQMIKEKFNSTMGFVLDHLRDFQLGNYLIELLSNCFPRKHIDKPGVMMPPVLWPDEPSKNEMIFGSLEYPFRGKHGYTQVTNFVWQKFGPQLENTLKVDNISYGTNASNSNGTKKFRSKKDPKEQEYCYVQVIHDCVYLWDGEGLFLELGRRYVDIVKTLKGYIRINVKDPGCIRSPDKMWLKLFQRTKWFQLLSEDKNQCEQFFKNINNYRKISEAQTFLLLNHADEDEDDGEDDGGNDNESPLTQDVSRKVQSENSQLATPDPSDAKIRTDEWDIDISSELQGTREEKRPKMTPENIDGNSNLLAAEDNKEEEQSPLVLAQKRKMIRETSRTLELLKKEFAQENNIENTTIQEIENHAIPERSPSLIITRFENKNQHSGKIPEEFPKNKPIKSPQPPPPTSTINKGVKSIGKKDINVLDTIFGTPKSNKKEKRQKALNNFRPVIDVPSQDLPKVQTRNDKKKEKALMMDKDSNPSKVKNSSVQTKIDKKRKPEMNPSKTPLSKKPKPALEAGKESEPPARLQPEKQSAPQKQVPAPKQDQKNDFASPLITETNADKSNTSLDSTTIVAPTFNPTPFGVNNAFTDKLQEQIYSSITLFSNELLRKMTIINKELNNKIVKELSEKYQNLFQQLQASFHNDTEEMFHFVGEIKDMLNLPEEELVRFIRTRKFGSQH